MTDSKPFPFSQAQIRELFDYDPDTGTLTRKTGSRAGHQVGSISRNKHNGKKYMRVSVFKGGYRLHRVIWFWMTGECPAQIDHANGDGLDNRWTNLSAATPTSNRRNTRRPKNNTSGYIGVTWVKKERKWRSRIMLQRKNRFLGLFLRFEDAVAARKAADIAYGFHPNHGQDRPL